MIGAFHHVSAVLLDDPAVTDIPGDVLVLGEDREAVDQVCELAAAIPGARGLYAGRLRLAGAGRGADRQPDRDQPPLQGPRRASRSPTCPTTADRAALVRRSAAHACTSSAARAARARRPSPPAWPARWPPAAAACCSARSRAGKGIAELFGVPPLKGDEERRVTRTPAGGAVFGLAIDAEDALREYLETFYHLGLAGRALDRFGAIDFATSIAPGLRDVLLTGKVYEAVPPRCKNRPNAYDAVVLDAPPTGRIAAFLNVHEAVSGLAKVGPIRSQADSIMQVLRSARTVVHLVTLLEDMPVTETEEAVAALRPTGITGRHGHREHGQPRPPSAGRARAAAAAGQVALDVPGLVGGPATPRWPPSSRSRRAQAAEQQIRHDRLRRLGLPLAQLDFDPAGHRRRRPGRRRRPAHRPARPGGRLMTGPFLDVDRHHRRPADQDRHLLRLRRGRQDHDLGRARRPGRRGRAQASSC